jgi:hypothetical protein
MKLKGEQIVTALLRPLVRICLARGIRLKECEQLLRRALVEEASKAILKSANTVSASKVSVITGIHRMEVTRFLEGSPANSENVGDVLTRVVGLWSRGKRYRGKDGTPKPLTFTGDQSQFAALVAEVSREGSHYSALYELERLSFIEYEEDKVHLRVEDFTPAPDADRGLSLLSEDLEDFASAVEHNIAGGGVDPALHLRTGYDNIDEADLPNIRQWLMEQGTEFHARMRAFLSKFDRDLSPKKTERTSTQSRVAVVTFAVAESQVSPKVIKPKKRGRKPCAR